MATDRVVDLDKLATDLVAEGITAKLIDGRLVLLHGTYSELDYISLPWPESPWADDFWKAIRIMAAHVAPVAPEPDAGLRERLNLLQRDISRFGDHKMQFGCSHERGDFENAEENRIAAKMLKEHIDTVIASLRDMLAVMRERA